MYYSKAFLVDFLQVLERIKARPPISGSGICGNISHVLDFGGPYVCHGNKLYKLRNQLFKLWPKCGRDITWPVPGGRWAYNDHSNKWDTYTRYGRSRYKLLDFMIEEVKLMIQYIDDAVAEQEEED